MNNIIDISTYNPNKNDKFFFDANIWMYLFCPIGNYRKDIVAKYDGFLKKAIQSKSLIFISSLVLSEFVNAYARVEFNILKKKYPVKYKDFKKDFRKTEKYKKLAKEIKTVVKAKILKLSKKINDKFKDINLDKVFENIEEADFNDNYYKVLLSGGNIKIVTDDYDFGRVDECLSVVTANHKLLKKINFYRKG